jgi:hypothetical protein
MYEKELSATWWMRPYGIDNFWRRAGGVDQTFENFDRLMARGDRVVYYPEGVPGIGKGFLRRYQLQPFHTAFIVMAARHNAPVYPVSIVNAEWVIPFTVTLKRVDRVMQRVFRVPFLPLPWAALAMVMPWAWFLAMPSRMVFEIGEPIDVAGLARRMGITDFADPDRYVMRQLAEHVRGLMQAGLSRAAGKYGRWPYQARLLRRELWKGRRELWRILPTGWPAAFIRHNRDRQREPAPSRLAAVLRDLDLAGFYVPFGWPLLSLARALRKPPYGYRGMSRGERRRVEGSYWWDLTAAPLPPREGAQAEPRAPMAASRAGHQGGPAVRPDDSLPVLPPPGVPAWQAARPTPSERRPPARRGAA